MCDQNSRWRKRGFKFLIILIGQCRVHFPCSVVGETRTLTKPSLEGRLELVYLSLAQLSTRHSNTIISAMSYLSKF